MNKDQKIKNLIYGMFDKMIEGADKYIFESSTWLIFTEERRWVLEFTKEKILWFNYNTFQSELNLLSIDCVESKDIIKKWFESRFLGIEVENTIQNGVKNSQSYGGESLKLVEDTIQNGVKDTLRSAPKTCLQVENTIQNGVKHTYKKKITRLNEVEDTIQNGVKSTFIGSLDGKEMVENTIKNGVKHTLSHFGSFPPPSKNNIQNVIQNGVKNTFSGAGDNYYEVDNTIQNGVKESYPHYFEGDINVKDTIKNGVKVMMSGSEWYHQDEVNDLIENKIKE